MVTNDMLVSSETTIGTTKYYLDDFASKLLNSCYKPIKSNFGRDIVGKFAVREFNMEYHDEFVACWWYLV